LVLLTGLVVFFTFTAGASAVPYATSGLTQVSGSSPFASCTADTGQVGTVFVGSEVEPFIDVNPANPSNIVGIYQQDRWSNGAARGLAAGVSFDGGASWTNVVIPNVSVCSGGNVANGGDFLRATDPWVSFSPNGHLYAMSLSVDINPPPSAPGGSGKNAMLVSKSTNGGLTWSDPVTLIRDENPRILNDKNSLTADPLDSRFVYAVWDRLVLNAGSVILPSFERAVGLGFDSPVYFARTTNGGVSWERARKIYDPGGNNQTIGSQIVALPNGTLVNAFMEFLNVRNDEGGGFQSQHLSLIRSFDKGATWVRKPIRAARIMNVGVRDPDTGEPFRTGDFLPDVAVDRTNGRLYAVWQDGRFSGFAHDDIAFTMSTDGGVTWNTPIKVNQTPVASGAAAFVPSVHVADDGVVAVSYYDFRSNDDAAGVPTDYWTVHCHATCSSAASWAEESHVAGPFDMEQAPDTERGEFLGDYAGLASVGNAFTPFFAQATGATDESDIWFARVAP
jgi:hypothetical protein